jgi:Bacterial dnaA protein helix-turn-helix
VAIFNDREDCQAAHATSYQRQLAQAHAERLKRLYGPPRGEKPFRAAILEPRADSEPAPAARPAPAIPAPCRQPGRLQPEVFKAIRLLGGPPPWLRLLPKPPKRPPYRRIIECTALEFGLNSIVLAGPQRTRLVATARQLAMWICLTLIPDASLNDVGRRFGRRDHSTVLHAKTKMIRLLAEDSDMRSRADSIIAAVVGRP